jgi:hypothetical protein
VGLGAIGGVPAVAAQRSACDLPKGWYTAQAEYQFAISLYAGQSGDSATQTLSALGSGNQAAITAALTNLTTGNANRTATFATATQIFVTKALDALAQQPPSCTRKRR